MPQCLWMLGANEVNRPYKENQDSQDYCLTKGDIRKSMFSLAEKGMDYCNHCVENHGRKLLLVPK